MIVGPFRQAGWYIIPTGAANMCPSVIQSVWRKRALSLRSGTPGRPIPLMHVNKHCQAADNALAETINGLYKTEQVHCQGPWRNMQDLEMAALGWVDTGVAEETPEFNTRRLLGSIGNIPPAKAEENAHARRGVLDMVA